MERILIIEYDDSRDRNQVIKLWKEVFNYKAPHHDPALSIDKKMLVSDSLFFVALHEGKVVGTIMAGYDGHRGWIYSLAVDPVSRKKGTGSALLRHAEEKLAGMGCLKINLQIMETNKDVEGFYIANGYTEEKRISMGKIMGDK